MRTLCFLVLLAVASAALAQEPAAPSGQFYGPLIPKGDAPKILQGNGADLPRTLESPLLRTDTPRPAVSRCAVPLLQMKAPKDVDPAFLSTPRASQVEPMPRAKLPPACEVSPGR
ncbi:MAG TPA: hypothetical protein VGG72_33330 [Bryobacteraceae bacterium]